MIGRYDDEALHAMNLDTLVETNVHPLVRCSCGRYALPCQFVCSECASPPVVEKVA